MVPLPAECVTPDLDEQALANLSPAQIRQILSELRACRVKLASQDKDLRQTQEALAISRARYEELYDLAPVGYLTLDGAGLIVEANRRAAAILATPKDELIGQPLSQFVHLTDQKASQSQFCQQIGVSDLPQSYDLCLSGKDGTTLWVRMDTAPIQPVANGSPMYRVVLTDISEYKQTEIALRHSQELMNYIIAHNQSAIAVYDREMRYIYVGKRYLDGYRAKGQEVIGRCHYEVFPGVPQKWRDAHQRVLSGEVLSAEEDFYVRDDGNVEWIRWECRPWYEVNGSIGGIVLYTEDITKRKQAEAALRASEERYRMLVQNLHAGIVVHGPDTQILLINEQAHQLLGISADQALGKTAYDPDWHFIRRNGSRLPLEEYPVMQVLTTQTPIENLVYGINRPATQDVIWVMVNAFPEFETDGSLRQIVVTFIDVSKQIQAEDLAHDLNKQLNHQERLAAVGQLAAGIAHDFNNILAVIALHVPMLGVSSEMNERDRKRLGVIQAQITHAARLIQQILDFSRRAVLERRPLDLATFLSDQVNLLTHTLPETIQVSLDCEPGQYVALVDLTRMQQMVMNLAVNARDAMPKGGSLRLTLTHHRTPPRPDLADGPWIRLTVADSGSGIPAEHLPHIFEPFFTTKTPGQGSGLGLAQVHGIVKQHGGEIAVQSIEGQGTTFTVYLPAMLEESYASSPQEAESWKGEGQTILIVEDNRALLDALQEIVEILGYSTVTARSGLDALMLLDRGEVAVDLILSDLVMPGMGGEDLLVAVRARGLVVPMVILSGHPLEGELAGLTERGLAGWLLKPVDVDLLAQTLTQVLAQ